MITKFIKFIQLNLSVITRNRQIKISLLQGPIEKVKEHSEIRWSGEDAIFQAGKTVDWMKSTRFKSGRDKGLREGRKLKLGALSLYMGNGQCEVVEAIGVFYLFLPSGLEIVLNNCHYAPSITRGVISVSRLYEDDFINRFMNNTIQVSRNNMVYFSAILRDGIFEIDLSNSYANDSSMYAISNKRAKLGLALLSCGIVMARKPYTHQVERAKDLLRLIHTDVCGPFKIMSRQGASYFVTFTDDFSRYGYVNLLKHKHEVFETFKVFQKEVENQLGKTIKLLRSNREGEYMSQKFLNRLKDHGIIAHRTSPYTPQHNEVSKRRNRTLLDMVRSMMSQTTLPKSFWDYALETAACILNMVPTKKVEKTPYEEHELGDLGKPTNYKAALFDPESDKWLNAMNVKMQSIKYNEVWDLVELLPNGKNAVGSIMYVVRYTRPDVAFAQNITSRFQQNPSDLHWTTVKNILKYLRNTKDMFLVYGGDIKRELRVFCYTDDGYLTDADDLKSQTGYVFVLNGGAVDWKSAKQIIFATSSAEADYQIPVVFVGSVDEVSSMIEDVFDIDESNLEGMQVRDKFAKFFEDKGSVEKVLSATKLPKGGNSHSTYSPYHLEDKVNFEGVGNVTSWATKVGRRKIVKCYVHVAKGGKGKSMQELVHASLNKTYLWEHCSVLKLLINMRLRVGCNPEDAEEIKEIAEWIMNIGDGKISGKNDSESVVKFLE
nr:retrotransposon protein, putative, Ty1-copia subclass [Tanacetum cinerariifolium]